MSNCIDLDKLKSKAYKGLVNPSRKKQKITNEELVELFNTLKDNWYLTEDLQKEIGDRITINVDNVKRTPINTVYLKRLSEETGERWRQRTGLTPEKKRLVKFYTAGKLK